MKNTQFKIAYIFLLSALVCVGASNIDSETVSVIKDQVSQNLRWVESQGLSRSLDDVAVGPIAGLLRLTGLLILAPILLVVKLFECTTPFVTLTIDELEWAVCFYFTTSPICIERAWPWVVAAP